MLYCGFLWIDVRAGQSKKGGDPTRSRSTQTSPPSTSGPTKVARANSLRSTVFAIHRRASFWTESSTWADIFNRQRRFDDVPRMLATSVVSPRRLFRVLRA